MIGIVSKSELVDAVWQFVFEDARRVGGNFIRLKNYNGLIIFIDIKSGDFILLQPFKRGEDDFALCFALLDDCLIQVFGSGLIKVWIKVIPVHQVSGDGVKDHSLAGGNAMSPAGVSIVVENYAEQFAIVDLNFIFKHDGIGGRAILF